MKVFSHGVGHRVAHISQKGDGKIQQERLALAGTAPPIASALEIDAALTLTRPPVIPRVLDRTHMQDFPAADAHC